jgi:hypothetical protein
VPVEQEPPRHGEGGLDRERCTASDDDYLWTGERWRLWAFDRPTGLPLVLLLEPREHFADPGDLPDQLASAFSLVVNATAGSGAAAHGQLHRDLGRHSSPFA